MAKSKAQDRTIGLFTGKTVEEEVRDQEVEEQEEVKEERVPMDVAVDTWRVNAFKCQEWTSKYFPQPGEPVPLAEAAKNAPNSNQYRLSIYNGHMYLEKAGVRAGQQFSYAGIMFPVQDVFELCKLFTEAAKEKFKETKNASGT